MLGKLIKYDLKWSIKLIAVFLGLGVIFLVIGKILELIPNSLLFEIITSICKGASVAMFANALCNSIFRSWARMTRNLYKDESYLTHTLPIDRSVHFASKVISQTILIITSAVLLVLAIFVMYFNKDVFEYFKTVIEFTSDQLNTSVAGLLTTLGLLAIIELVFIGFCGNFGIIVGHNFNKRKTLMSIIFGIVAYYAISMILLGCFMIISIFDKNIYAIIFEQNEIMNFGSMMFVSYVCIAVYTIAIFALYFVSNHLFRKGVNID